MQTETVFHQVLQKCVNLFVNKVDCCTLERQTEPEDMYSQFRGAIENVNVIISSYNDALTFNVLSCKDGASTWNALRRSTRRR